MQAFQVSVGPSKYVATLIRHNANTIIAIIHQENTSSASVLLFIGKIPPKGNF
jgi:hypothetical protein